MRYFSVFFVLSALLFATFPVYSDTASEEGVRDEIVGLFGSLLAPSIFTTAKSEQLSISVYGRSLTAEGEVPGIAVHDSLQMVSRS